MLAAADIVATRFYVEASYTTVGALFPIGKAVTCYLGLLSNRIGSLRAEHSFRPGARAKPLQ